MNIETAVNEVASILRQNNFTNAFTEALLLSASAIKTTKENLLMCGHYTEITPADYAKLTDMLKLRLSHVPVSQIIGIREFWGHEISVTRNTLDPRPDSETIIQALIDAYPNRNAVFSLADLGVGSGCLTIAAAKEYPRSCGIAIDLNSNSLIVARENFRQHDILHRFRLHLRSWTALPQFEQRKFDVVISNPPYIPATQINSLQCEIRMHEPMLALKGGCSGLEAIISIFCILPQIMKEKGIFICEIGHGQSNMLCSICHQYGLFVHRKYKDLSGIIRCLMFKHKNKHKNSSELTDVYGICNSAIQSAL